MTSGLPESKQRFQNVHSRFLDSHLIDTSQKRLPIMMAQSFIDPALAWLQLAIDRLLRLRRQFARHLLLGSAQDEGPERFRKDSKRLIRCSCGRSVLF